MKQDQNTSAANLHEAVTRAQNSHKAAMEARRARDRRNFMREILKDWTGIFVNSHVIIMTSLFLTAVLVEIIFSFPMYVDLMSQMLGRGSDLLALIVALFIVSWGAYASHLLARKVNPHVLEYTVYNDRKYSVNLLPAPAAAEKARLAGRKAFIAGIIHSLFLLTAVASISWQRVILVGFINGEDYSLIHKLLPVLCVLVEIFSGIYIGYVIRRFYTLFKVFLLEREFIRERNICTYETNMAIVLQEHALWDEKLSSNKELHDAIYRYEERVSGEDDYVDPIPAKVELPKGKVKPLRKVA